MAKKEYIDTSFKDLLTTNNNKEYFKVLWNREDPWFEEPNIGRRDSKTAWSGVSRIQIADKFYYLKKQENYFTYSVNLPVRQLIVKKEYTNIKLFESKNIPCLDVVYFGIRKKKAGFFGKSQGILITKALDNYISLDEAFDMICNMQGSDKLTIKKTVIDKVASLVNKTHRAGLMHRCLYPKHIYIDKDFCRTGRQSTRDPVCRFIDLESARKVPYLSRRQLRDLETLERRSPEVSRDDKLYFLLKYFDKTNLDKETRALIKRIQSIRR